MFCNELIVKTLNENNRLYCAFVDLKKAFDSVNRNALWLKMYKCGIGGKMLRIVRSMYFTVKSCVRHCGTYSDIFEYAIGLRQGEVLSPLMFSVFLEDLELFLQDRIGSGLEIEDLTLILLLFADDMVLFGKSPEDLQHSLHLLYAYCEKWELIVIRLRLWYYRKRRP